MKHEEQKTYVFVHGAWHGAWCWDAVRPLIEAAGHKTIAMDLQIENPNANYDDDTDQILDEIAGQKNVRLVVHSRGGNLGPIVASRTQLDRLIYLCSRTPAFVNKPVQTEAPSRNTSLFRRGIIDCGNGLTRYDPDIAHQVFYNECTDKAAQAAVSQLRLQRSAEPAVPVELPDVSTSFIYTTHDNVITQEYSRFIAKNVLGVEPIEIAGDHSPFLSHPAELAATLLKL